VESFYANEYSKLALPLLLSEEIYGFGFALACDFLKSNGYKEFVSQTRNIKELTKAFGITTAITDYEVFRPPAPGEQALDGGTQGLRGLGRRPAAARRR